jgi:hypothetical protein
VHQRNAPTKAPADAGDGVQAQLTLHVVDDLP